MDELDRHLEHQMQAQERQLVAVRFAIVAFAGILLAVFHNVVPGLSLLGALLAAVAAYDLVILVLIAHFPAREVGIVATALDMVAVTVGVYAAPGAIDAYLFYGLVVLGAAVRFGLAASVWSAFVCSSLYAAVVLFITDAGTDVRRLLLARIMYLLGIGLAAGLFSRLVIGRANEVAELQTRLDLEERERTRAREEALLSQLAREFGSSLDREATVAAIVHATAEVIGDVAALWLVDQPGERIELAGVVARDDTLAAQMRDASAERASRMGEGIIGRTAATATTTIVVDRSDRRSRFADGDSADDPVAAIGESVGAPSLRSVVAVPILGRGRVRGVLMSGSVGNVPLGDGERRLLEAIAERAGPALENAALWADLEERMAREQEAQRVKDDFLSIVSHELRTPLTSISGYAQLLEGRMRGHAERAKELDQLAVIRAQSTRMRRLVDDLLDVSRIDRRGGVGVEPEPFDLAAEIDEAVARTRRQHSDRRIEREVPATLPIVADRDRINQVLTNLLDNAVKYSPEGGAVRISADRDAAGVQIGVSDEGVGIPEALRDRVFDLFFQADGDAPQRRFGGLGLGLYISRAIVEAHHGRIWAEPNTTAGHGTVMRVQLPLQAERRAIGAEAPPTGEPPPFVVRPARSA
jgi:signal transduction histidine kinase